LSNQANIPRAERAVATVETILFMTFRSCSDVIFSAMSRAKFRTGRAPVRS